MRSDRRDRSPIRSLLLATLAIVAMLAASCASPARPVLLESLSPTAEPEPQPTTAGEAVPAQDDTPTGSEDAPAQADSPDCLRARQWIGQVINVLATQDELEGVVAIAERGEVGGVTVLGTPDVSITSELRRLDEAGPVSVIAASDEEGGAVQRLAGIIGPLDPASTSAQRPSADVRDEFARYGEQMKDLGFDIAFAPVADVGAGPGIGSRSFGSDPAVVTEYAGAVADGYSSAGIQPVFKHFPGHGRATGDSHLGLPTTPPWSEMQTVDLIPYETLLDRPDAAVMVGHLIVPDLTNDLPTSLSPATVTQLLRGTGGETFDGRTFGFEGLVFVDALNMGAITDNFGTTEAVVLALAVGADVVILGGANDVGPTIDAVLSAIGSGTLSWERIDEAAGRVLAFKGEAERTRCA